MKTESSAAYIARLAITLLLITAVVATLLAEVNAVTEPRIETLNAEKTQTAIEAVLPGGGEEIAFTDDSGIVSTIYKGQSGYAVEVTPAGFNGTVTMMVGVDNSGKVLGISIVNHTETAGLGGAEAASQGAAGTAFRSQFAGMSGSVSVSKDGGQVDALTGATITSRAVCTGVNAALNAVAKLG